MHVIHPFTHVATADASSTYAFIVLSSYQRTMKIGQSFYLIGVASNGKTVKWKSSNTKTASVNTYGQVTAKKAGTCKITAKITGAEASCSVTVQKTEITLNYSNLTMENGSSITLHATTSNGAAVTWKSSKTSVVTIDDNGYLEAQKPGSATITASADGSKQTCKITVKTPKVTLGASSIRLYRNQTYKLDVKVSSGRTPAFSSQKGSVASVNEKGIITAYKHGTARIYVKIDGITRTCVVTVVSPEITLTPASATLKKGKTLTLKTVVSSGCTPVYSSSKPSVATVDARGKITAVSKGTCIIYASEDGTKASCKITVSES
jgi:uncharacterized protein YjdB